MLTLEQKSKALLVFMHKDTWPNQIMRNEALKKYFRAKSKEELFIICYDLGASFQSMKLIAML